jgi:hypothetical protein
VSRKRSSFTPEFKDELVKLYLEQRASKTVSQVARENGVGPETLRNHVCPGSFGLLDYPSAIDLSTSTLTFLTEPGSGGPARAASRCSSVACSTRGYAAALSVMTSAGVTLVVSIARSKNLRAASLSRREESYTSMTWPNWSTARYRYRHRPATFTYVSSTNQRSPTARRHGRAASASSGANRWTHR